MATSGNCDPPLLSTRQQILSTVGTVFIAKGRRITLVNIFNCYIYSMSSISSKFKSGDDFQSLEPRIHRMSDFKRVKEILDLIQFVTILYSRFLLLSTFALRVLITYSVSRLAPPYGVKKRGLKGPCSISIIPWLYNRFFSFSFRSKFFCMAWHKWVKHPYIEKCSLIILPKPADANIETCIIGCVR